MSRALHEHFQLVIFYDFLNNGQFLRTLAFILCSHKWLLQRVKDRGQVFVLGLEAQGGLVIQSVDHDSLQILTTIINLIIELLLQLVNVVFTAVFVVGVQVVDPNGQEKWLATILLLSFLY